MSTTKIQEKDLSQSLVDKIDNKASNEQLNNLQEEMNEVKKSVSDGKELVAGAITNKGVPTSGSDAYATMATNINSITTLDIGTSDATISAGDVLNGKVGYGKDGARVVGNMPNNSGATVGWSGYETITVQPHPQDSSQGLITISNQYGNRGYFDSNSKITGNMANLNAGNIKAGVAVGQVNGNSSNSIVGTFTSDANASAGHILSGYSGYVNGSKVNGSIPLLDAQTIYPTTSNQTIWAGYYLAGNQTIAGDANLVAGNIRNGASIFGVAGTYTDSLNLNSLVVINPRSIEGFTSKSGYYTGSYTGTGIPKLVYVSLIYNDNDFTCHWIPGTSSKIEGYGSKNTMYSVTNTSLVCTHFKFQMTISGNQYTISSLDNGMYASQLPIFHMIY